MVSFQYMNFKMKRLTQNTKIIVDNSMTLPAHACMKRHLCFVNECRSLWRAIHNFTATRHPKQQIFLVPSTCLHRQCSTSCLFSKNVALYGALSCETTPDTRYILHSRPLDCTFTPSN